MGIGNFGSSGIRSGVCTSTTRPSAPYDGQMIYETDTDTVRVWNGSTWQAIGGTPVGSFFSYTPSTSNPASGTSITATDLLLGTMTVTPTSTSDSVALFISYGINWSGYTDGMNQVLTTVKFGPSNTLIDQMATSSSFYDQGMFLNLYVSSEQIAYNKTIIHSPATTSATTYNVYVKAPAAGFGSNTFQIDYTNNIRIYAFLVKG